jgi:hypothetical protein
MLLIADLQGADFDVSLTGFEPAELDNYLRIHSRTAFMMMTSMLMPNYKSLHSPNKVMFGNWVNTDLFVVILLRLKL